ncbi:hypothetical protein EDC27_1603 [Desulfosoma caldarium]|uniref:Uncharacterized protein n=1 Tax=Desulfosoma caldarium TaxID=610254 RepID=A0A3N1UR45_9BACT|nr:hypothetical protein EDC27_1603 [Desulfosoma caldarium]
MELYHPLLKSQQALHILNALTKVKRLKDRSRLSGPLRSLDQSFKATEGSRWALGGIAAQEDQEWVFRWPR